MNIKARRDYLTDDRGHGSEKVRVTGFQSVTVGTGANERTEKWCRVRLADGGRVLMHPTSLLSQ